MKLRINNGPAQGELVSLAVTPPKADEIIGYEIAIGQVATVRVGIKSGDTEEMVNLSSAELSGVCAAIAGGDSRQASELVVLMNASISAQLLEGINR